MDGKSDFQDFINLILNTDSETVSEHAKRVNQRSLINVLNCINFKDGVILTNFKHFLYGNLIAVPVKPMPCFSNVLDCSWVNFKIKKSSNYKFINFFISDGYKMIIVKPEVKKIDNEGLTFILPEVGYDINRRGIKRYQCKNIEVEIIQAGQVFRGLLTDFNGEAFCVKLSNISLYELQYSKFDSKSTVLFKKDGNILFSGECIVIRDEISTSKSKIVFSPAFDCIQRYKPKEVRSYRQKFIPSPTIIFRHPLIDKLITLKVEDLSGSGLSVEESYSDSLLIPGLIIDKMEIEFTPGFKIDCKAQVVYRKVIEREDEKLVRCGIAFIELDIQDQIKLSAFLHRTIDEKSYVCNRVDLEALWDFFFETGFFYAEKYSFLYSNKDKLKELYERLYCECPNIARHFIYQDKGKIFAHISMLRIYDKTWLIHHHASLKSNFRTIGQIILRQLGLHINDFRHIHSSHMNYLLCIYRPENKFPHRVFGGFASHLNNIKGCSTDSFGYLYYKAELFESNLSDSPLDFMGWKLNKSLKEDLLELENFYEKVSGGLLLNALELKSDNLDKNFIKQEFESLGFRYERKIFSLKREGELVALIEAVLTDVGFNLSNFTNSIKVFVLNPELLNPRTLFFSLYLISKNYSQKEIPVMVYPLNYFEIQPINYNKVYNLWILDTKFGDEYLKFTENLLIHRHNL